MIFCRPSPVYGAVSSFFRQICRDGMRRLRTLHRNIRIKMCTKSETNFATVCGLSANRGDAGRCKIATDVNYSHYSMLASVLTVANLPIGSVRNCCGKPCAHICPQYLGCAMRTPFCPRQRSQIAHMPAGEPLSQCGWVQARRNLNTRQQAKKNGPRPVFSIALQYSPQAFWKKAVRFI